MIAMTNETLPQVKQIASRIRELREIIGTDPADVAADIGVDLAKYKEYERGEDDIPIGKLYMIAEKLGVDPTVLLVGEGPRMEDYTLVRAGKGIRVERYAGYEFTSLAYNYKDREMEPMIVTLGASDVPPEPVTHEGQEFNYVIEGHVAVTIGSREFILGVGDSIYFNPAIPHGQRAVGGNARFITVINERMAQKKNNKQG